MASSISRPRTRPVPPPKPRVRTVAQTAMSQLAAAVPSPGSNPAQMLSQAAGSTDRIAALIQAVTGGAPTDH